MRIDKARKNRGLAEVLPVCTRKCRLERYSGVDRPYLAACDRYRAICNGRGRDRQNPASAVESGHFLYQQGWADTYGRLILERQRSNHCARLAVAGRCTVAALCERGSLSLR